MTGMNIDHFMLADFNAVKQLTTTLGGVEVCVDTAVKDPASGLDLPAGKSNIQGEQALSFLRERHAIYMADSGRANLVGIADADLDRFCAAVVEAMDG